MKRKINQRKDNISDDFIIDETTECQLKMNHIQQATQDLYDAIANNDFILAKTAIENGADINAQGEPCTESDDSPLDSAAFWANTYSCSLEMIQLLRKSGATNYSLDKVKFIQESEKCLLVDAIQHRF